MTDPTHIPVEEPGQRIAKFLAAAGIASRRACEALVEAGRVTVNGTPVASLGLRVDPERDAVALDGQPLELPELRYVMLNKPAGYTCSASDAHAGRLVNELFPRQFPRLFTVGRLDRDSEGLLICTNDGEFAERIAHPRHEIAKKYLVWVDGAVRPLALRRLEMGIEEGGERLRALAVRQHSRRGSLTCLEFVLGEGRKREIRRMCRFCQWRVQQLTRTQIGPLKLGGLAIGQWRELTADERQALLDAAVPS